MCSHIERIDVGGYLGERGGEYNGVGREGKRGRRE